MIHRHRYRHRFRMTADRHARTHAKLIFFITYSPFAVCAAAARRLLKPFYTSHYYYYRDEYKYWRRLFCVRL